jgi:hypothetical protein
MRAKMNFEEQLPFKIAKQLFASYMYVSNTEGICEYI